MRADRAILMWVANRLARTALTLAIAIRSARPLPTALGEVTSLLAWFTSNTASPTPEPATADSDLPKGKAKHIFVCVHSSAVESRVGLPPLKVSHRCQIRFDSLKPILRFLAFSLTCKSLLPDWACVRMPVKGRLCPLSMTFAITHCPQTYINSRCNCHPRGRSPRRLSS